jgi:hypothetical protein
MKSCCDEYCSTHGCNQGRNCPVRESRIDKHNTLFICIEAVLFLVILVMALLTWRTW